MIIHQPVLLNESIEYLVTDPAGTYFDGTIGFGSHAGAILKRLNKKGILFGVDKDINAVDYCKGIFTSENRLKIYNTAFTDIDTIARIDFIDSFSGIFADLGVSSFQLDNKNSGFTYREEAPLDLRMDKQKGITAAEVVNKFGEDELQRIFTEFGEEKKSGLIAGRIIKIRKIKKIITTTDLKNIVSQVVPDYLLNKSLSRIFQALRIFVNRELEELKEFLRKSVDLLKIDGRLVIISYHSLEDRIVKDFFKYESLACVCPPDFPICVCNKKPGLKILTKKPVIPKEEEIKNNKRARSAKLRAAQKI